jgi:hypothetical protein
VVTSQAAKTLLQSMLAESFASLDGADEVAAAVVPYTCLTVEGLDNGLSLRR